MHVIAGIHHYRGFTLNQLIRRLFFLAVLDGWKFHDNLLITAVQHLLRDQEHTH